MCIVNQYNFIYKPKILIALFNDSFYNLHIRFLIISSGEIIMSYSDQFKTIEAYFQNKDKQDFSFNDKPFYYIVPMFPYPSGNIHMGHIRNYSISNVIARYKKTRGFNVLHPIGFDSFGLPAEVAAIKNKVTPNEWTKKNIVTMISDFKSIGFDFDWSNTVKTHEFDYYKFEQDIFKRAWNNGLIYKKDKYVNYDPVDKTILSNEQVHNGKGWRSGATVIRKKIPMYFFNMKKYAIELNDSLKEMTGWPQKVIDMQKNWIGIIDGVNNSFKFNHFNLDIFNSIEEPSTVLIGINHEFVKHFHDKPEFNQWFTENNKGSVSEKTTFNKKNWFETSYCVNFNNKIIPIYIDMNRDEEAIFVKDISSINSTIEVGSFVSSTPHKFIGLKDWCISRQRYWGNPIPMISCDKCGDVPSEDNVKLPEELIPDGNGNILDKTPEFVNCKCPSCGGDAFRCTDTMDTFVQSSWYYQRYVNPNSTNMIDNPAIQIDTYVGGIEHATMHLIYTRFFHKMLRDFNIVSTDEPIKKLITQGMVCKKYEKPDGTIASAKMSKSLGNVVAPNEYIDKYGADAIQMFIIFAAPPTDNFDFEDAGIVGTFRFLDDIYRYFFETNNSTKNMDEKETYKIIQKMTKYIDQEFEGRGNLNTIIPQLMMAFKAIKKTDFKDVQLKTKIEEEFISNLSIFAPNLSEYIKDFKYNNRPSLKI